MTATEMDTKPSKSISNASEYNILTRYADGADAMSIVRTTHYPHRLVMDTIDRLADGDRETASTLVYRWQVQNTILRPETADDAVRVPSIEPPSVTPEPARQQPSTVSIPRRVDSVQKLLEQAEDSGDVKLSKLCAKVRGLVEEIWDRHTILAEHRAAEAEVARLEAALAEARGKLKGTKSSGSASSSKATSGTSSTKERNRRIRAWANENGYTVAERGAIAAHIIEAYEQATGGAS